jgi:hypothetical protein
MLRGAGLACRGFPNARIAQGGFGGSFKSIRDPMLTDALTWAFRLLDLWIVLDHPAYIPPCPPRPGFTAG